MREAKLYHFDSMKLEKITDTISRRYIAGENGMLACFLLKKGAVIPEHHHVSEQITYILEGAVRVYCQKQEFLVRKGQVLIIPPNAPHKFEALEDAIDLDVFSPIREDWLKGTDSYLKQGK